MYYVYHISDVNNLNEGYIGVTKKPEKRWKQHCKSMYTIGKTIRRNDWNYEAHFKIIFEGNKEECFKYEKHLRPENFIGLNEASGGLGGDVAGLSERWKIERVGIGNPNYGKKRSIDTKNKMSHSMKMYYKSDKFTEEKRNVYKTELSRLGAESVRGSSWWNNGKDNIRSIYSPGKDWIKGRLPCDREYKETIYYAQKQKTKSVTIEGITYFSINEASRQTGKCRQTIRKMLKNEK